MKLCQSTLALCTVLIFFLRDCSGFFGKKKDGEAQETEQLERVYAAKAAAALAEKEKIEAEIKNRGGSYNAKLGLNELSKAARDPNALLEAMEMMKDPEIQKEVQAMMRDPDFQAELRQYTENPAFKQAMQDAKVSF